MNQKIRNYFYQLMTDQQHGIMALILKCTLWVLSLFFQFAICLRKALYNLGVLNVEHLAKPVISIGNVTMGGSGKTPLVISIAQYLKSKGIKPAILSRGYMAREAVDSDEALMMREILGDDVPVLVGKNRVASAKDFLSKSEADVFILDDGFQHWRIHRNLNIVAIDSVQPFGNGHLIPRGILREPKKALKRADLVVLTKIKDDKTGGNLVHEIRRFNPAAKIVKTNYHASSVRDLHSNEHIAPELLNGLPVLMCCSIGAPQSFKMSIEHIGAVIQESLIFEDHYVYQEKDILAINDICRKSNLRIVMSTHKDAVKFKPFMHLLDIKIKIFILNIEINFIDGKSEFFNGIDHILSA